MKCADDVEKAEKKRGARIREVVFAVLKDTEDRRLTWSGFVVSCMIRLEANRDDVLATIRDMTFWPVVPEKDER